MSKDLRTVTLIRKGIPPQFVDTTQTYTGKKEILDTLKSLVDNLTKLLSTGSVLYIASPYETSALNATVQLCKKAEETNISWHMEALPVLLDMLKDFDGDHKDKFSDVLNSDLLCLYMVGKEYPTDFTTSYVRQLLDKRKVAGRVTVLCSHMALEEFMERYGKGISLCMLPLTDENELSNFKALKRFVES